MYLSSAGNANMLVGWLESLLGDPAAHWDMLAPWCVCSSFVKSIAATVPFSVDSFLIIFMNEWIMRGGVMEGVMDDWMDIAIEHELQMQSLNHYGRIRHTRERRNR